jgi:hypothetical protein
MKKKFKGELAGFPAEVVEKMLERQVEQTGKKNVEVFEDRMTASQAGGGFDWKKTAEGEDFWWAVIGRGEFDLFFERYPRVWKKRGGSERTATDKERKLLLDALKKEGKGWDAKNKRVYDLEPEFKDGDFVRSSWDNGKHHGVGILRGEYKKGEEIDCYCLMSTDGGFTRGYGCSVGITTTRFDRPASEMDKKWLEDAMKENGLRWNAAEKRVEDLRWRAKEGETFEYIKIQYEKAVVSSNRDLRQDFSSVLYAGGNYYNPATGDAQRDADKINAIFNENKSKE